MKMIKKIILVLIAMGLISVGFYLWYSKQHHEDEVPPVEITK